MAILLHTVVYIHFQVVMYLLAYRCKDSSCIILTYNTAIPCTSLPELQNGVINLDLAAKTVTYTCNTGYDLIGNAMRTCMLDGTWTGTDSTCMGKKFTIYITSKSRIIMFTLTRAIIRFTFGHQNSP